MSFQPIIILTLLLISFSANSITFVPGDYYTSTYFSNTINHYSKDGLFVDSITVPNSYGSDVKGISFNSTGNMYAVTVRGGNYDVLSISNDNTIQTIASGTGYIQGNLSYGKIATDNFDNYYVAGAGNLTSFTSGSSFGDIIYSENQVYDVEVLPSGNLLVLSAYTLREITPSGSIVRNISSDIRLGDARGVEYDPATDSIYVTMLGYTNQNFRLMKLNGQTGVVEENVSYIYGDDLFLTTEGKLLVGSRTQVPGIFDTDLNLLNSFEGSDQMFVTQFTSAVPIPAAAWLFISGLICLISFTKNRS